MNKLASLTYFEIMFYNKENTLMFQHHDVAFMFSCDSRESLDPPDPEERTVQRDQRADQVSQETLDPLAPTARR